MARGHLFHITTDKDEDISFDESNYYEKLDMIGSYVENQTKEQSEYSMKWLSDTLTELGAVTDVGSIHKFSFSFRFDKVEQMLQEYFRPRLEQLKKEAAALELFKVIRSAPNLDYICNNGFTDAVELYDPDTGDGGTFLTFDDFIRQVRPGVTYYVYERVIMMH